MSGSLHQDRKQSLQQLLRTMTAPAAKELVRAEEGGAVRCLACAHRCLVRPGREGICRVRFNQEGELRVPYGYVAGLACDPIEKKPFYHFLPGSDIVTFGMLGCDLHCGYCQNWITSQALREDSAGAEVRTVRPEQIVEIAVSRGSPAVASSYNEPLITSEWAAAVFRPARAAGLKCCYISNGNATPEVLAYLRPLLDGYKIDLKSFQDRHYRELGGVLENVLKTIRLAKEMGFWVEIVTLLVPGFNDGAEELRAMAGFLAETDELMPWHVTAFHSDYRMGEVRNTTVEDLLAAGQIARAAGLKYVYLGNVPGIVGDWENTCCHGCGRVLIRREGFFILRNILGQDGRCPQCGTVIPGVWS